MIFRIGKFELDTQAYELRKNGDAIAIEPQVFDLLRLLIVNRDRVVTKEEIHRTIWEDRIVSDSALSNRIKAARKALGDSGREQSLIQTYHGRGFRFVGQIESRQRNEVENKSPSTPIALRHKLSIVVLPFDNMSGDAEQEYFSDGITEDITTDLSHVSDLFVVARNTSFTYKGKSVTAVQICEDLEVRYLLQGSVRKAGARVRITAQLVDGLTGGQLWAERYDRDISDVFAVQSEIAHSIADALKVALAPSEKHAIAKHPTADINAYDYCLRGREYFHRLTRKNLEYAHYMFAKAIEVDPLYALAYAGLADCCSRLYQYYDNDPKHLEEGFSASTKALGLDPQLAEAHASRGLILSLDLKYDDAEKEFTQALQLNDTLYEAYFFCGRACFARGNTERAAELFNKAAQVRPGDFQSLMMLGNAYRVLGRRSELLATAERSFKFAEQRVALNPDDVRATYAGAAALTDLGDRTGALEWVDRVVSIDSDDTTTYYNLGCIYALWGESEKAIDCLHRALDDSNIAKRREWIEKDGDLDSLRSHPRFRSLLAALD